jgi:general nucleoside transport system ATP-binding protein
VSSTSDQRRQPALELRGVAKRFGDVTALDSVDFTVSPGSVHALIGENGAGKSTLMRITYGLLPPDAGTIRLFGATIAGHSVRQAIQSGVGMVHQHLSLAPNLSVTENLVLGGAGLFRPGAAEDLLRRTESSSGLSVPHDALARDLSIVEQQRLEILKALARGARLLILDEPTAVLAPAEIDDLLRWIREFATGGGSVVLVTHKLREALAVADEITVLRRGRVVRAGSAATISEHELARAIFPESLEVQRASATPTPGEPLVQADAVDITDARGARRIHHAAFALHRHEIVGIAAVEGSGHRELLQALAALLPPSSGILRLPERIGLIPADRNRDGLVLEFTLVENVALHQLGKRRGLIPWQLLADRTSALLKHFNIVASSAWARARDLSGGNQQRLVVARELEHALDLVVADNPTRGLDVRATAFVHGQLRDAAARGAVVVVHSSDLDEILSLATRVLVVFHGDVREVGLDREEVGRAMLGAA